MWYAGIIFLISQGAGNTSAYETIAIALTIHGEAYIQQPEIPIFTTLAPLQVIKRGSIIRIEKGSMVTFKISDNIIRLFGPTTIKIDEIENEKGIQLLKGRVYGNFKKPFRLKTNRVSAVIRGTKVSVIKQEQEVWKVIKGTIEVNGFGPLKEGQQLNPDKGKPEKLVLDSIDLLNLALDAREGDTIPPAIRIEKADITNRKQYTFRVITDPKSRIIFKDKIYTADTSGEVTITTNLEKEINYMTITAIDTAGNMARTGFLVKLDTTPPHLKVLLRRKIYVNAPETAIPVEGEPATLIRTNNGKITRIPPTGYLEIKTLLKPGENHLEFTGIDEAGNESKATADVVFDMTIPSIAFLNPIDTITNRETLTVALKIVDERPAGLVINGKAISIKGKKIVRTFHLKEGENLFNIYAVDSAGNVSHTTLRVIRDTKPPLVRKELQITTYQTISGRVKKGALVFINGQPVPVDAEGKFNYEIPLKKGKNIVTIRVIDPAGNESVERRIIQVP